MPATIGPYFINTDNFEYASGVWTDAALTTCAPQGYYSNGVTVRYLTNAAGGVCSLGPGLNCPTCEPATIVCGTVYNVDPQITNLYKVNADLGVGQGVCLVTIDPDNQPDAIACKFEGQIIAEGVAQFNGYAANNNTSGSTNVYDNLVFVGTMGNYTTNFAGLTGSGSPGCISSSWDIGTYPAPPISNNAASPDSTVFDVQEWDDATAQFSPTGSSQQIEISNYNASSGRGDDTVTEMAVMGLDGAGVVQANTGVAACDLRIGTFCIPVCKTQSFNQQVEVNFAGGYNNTGFEFTIVCPQTPQGFNMSQLLLETNDGALTPSCTGTTINYQNTLWMVSTFNAAESVSIYEDSIGAYVQSNYGNNVLAINSFAYMNPNPTNSEFRWNEGAVAGVNPTGGTNKYQWYKVSLVLGLNPGNVTNGNQYKTIDLTNPGTSNQVDLNYDTDSSTALIQIDNHGIITRIVRCEDE